MERWSQIAELALILAVLILRRFDVKQIRARLATVATNQGALVELVRSSLRPDAQQRCGDCDHQQGEHTSGLGELRACKHACCSCRAWVEPPAPITFADPDETPARGSRTPKGAT